jgi:hypothetical protein
VLAHRPSLKGSVSTFLLSASVFPARFI